MEDLRSVIDITSENFVEMLPVVADAIDNCDFMAFVLDLGGKGSQSYHKSVQADTVRNICAFQIYWI